MNEKIPSHYIKLPSGEWSHPSRIMGGLPNQIAQPESAPKPLEQKASRPKISRTCAPHSGPLCRVTITSHRKRLLDDDNLRGGSKAIRDAIAVFLGLDDNERYVQWQYGQIETRGRCGTVVTIEPIE